MLKPSQPYFVQGGVAFQVPKFGKGRKFIIVPFYWTFLLFFAIMHACPYFLE